MLFCFSGKWSARLPPFVLILVGVFRCCPLYPRMSQKWSGRRSYFIADRAIQRIFCSTVIQRPDAWGVEDRREDQKQKVQQDSDFPWSNVIVQCTNFKGSVVKHMWNPTCCTELIDIRTISKQKSYLSVFFIALLETCYKISRPLLNASNQSRVTSFPLMAHSWCALLAECT